VKENAMWGFMRRNRPKESHSKDIGRAFDQLAYIEESVAYSSFLASGVAGVESVSFEEFIKRYYEAKKLC
jgi:hypothetical protein